MNSGFVNLLKPSGATSHDMVNALRRVFSTRSVGHMGTLDPAAAGVLPIAVGKATRLIPYVGGTDKVYRAEIWFGLATDTEDTQGKILQRHPVWDLPEADIKKALSGFVGPSAQIPPMFSALKVNGKRLYQLARNGQEVERAPRDVHIASIELLSYSQRESTAVALIQVQCSRGTYVRSLCRDVGASIGLPACMGFLLRERSGPFTLTESVTLPELREAPVLIPPAQMFPPASRLLLDPCAALRFVQGQRVSIDAVDGSYAVLLGGTMLGVGEVGGGVMAPARVLVERSDLPFERY